MLKKIMAFLGVFAFLIAGSCFVEAATDKLKRDAPKDAAPKVEPPKAAPPKAPEPAKPAAATVKAPEPSKTPEPAKSVVATAKPLPEPPKDAAPKPADKPLTPKEKKKKEIEDLLEEQSKAAGKAAYDPNEGGVMDRMFNKAGGWVAQKFPGISAPLLRIAIKTQKAGDNIAPLRKINEKCDWINSKITTDIGDKFKVSSKEFDAAFKSDAKQKEFAEAVGKIADPTAKSVAEQKFKDDLNTSLRTDKVAAYDKKKGIDKKSEDALEKLKKDPKKYADELRRIGEMSKIDSARIEAAIKDPNSQDAKDLGLRAKLVEDIKEQARKTTKAKIWGWLNEMHDGRDLMASKKGLLATGILMIASTLIVTIGGLIASKLKSNEIFPPVFGPDQGKALGSGGADLITLSSGEKLTTNENDAFNLLGEVIKYYMAFDEKFKNALKSADYNKLAFSVASRVNYEKLTATAGMSALFNYSGAGDIATGLTPVIIKIYPTNILGQAISQREILSGITNEDTMELVAAFMRNAPEVIFFLKIISLLNTANKQFTDADQRLEFLNEQVRLIYTRFVRTVDYAATARSNAFEKNEKKWEDVYMKLPGQCFQGAPKIIRDFVAELTVDARDTDGKQTKISLEQYLVDQFDEFQDIQDVEFEGEPGYEQSDKKLDDAAVKDYLYALFLRALDDVSDLEDKFVTSTTPEDFIGADGVKQSIVGKNLFQSITAKAFKVFNNAQDVFIDQVVEYAANPTDADVVKSYKSAEMAMISASSSLEDSTLAFRKKMSFYPFEKMLGYLPERVFDYVRRECKRAYLLAENKDYFLAELPKTFSYFAKSFPFTAKDLLVAAQEPGPLKPPARVITPDDDESELLPKKDVGTVPEPEISLPEAA